MFYTDACDEGSQSMQWSCSWKHVCWGFFQGWGGWILKKDKIPKCHACLFHQTKIEWPNKKQDKWPFPVNTKHYHFPEVSSSKYGILFERGKRSRLKIKGNCALLDKMKGIYDKENGKSFLSKPSKKIVLIH